MLLDNVGKHMKKGHVNILLIHGLGTACALHLQPLGTILLNDDLASEILNGTRSEKWGEGELRLMWRNREMCKKDPHIHICASHQDVQSTFMDLVQVPFLEKLHTTPKVQEVPSTMHMPIAAI